MVCCSIGTSGGESCSCSSLITHLLQGAAIMAAPCKRCNLDMEHSYNTHRAAPGLISVRWNDNWAQAALYCSYFNRLLSTVLHTYSRNTHEGKISHSLRKPNIEKTQQLEKANRQ